MTTEQPDLLKDLFPPRYAQAALHPALVKRGRCAVCEHGGRELAFADVCVDCDRIGAAFLDDLYEAAGNRYAVALAALTDAERARYDAADEVWFGILTGTLYSLHACRDWWSYTLAEARERWLRRAQATPGALGTALQSLADLQATAARCERGRAALHGRTRP